MKNCLKLNRLPQLLATLLLAALWAGCGVVPTYRPPDYQPPAPVGDSSVPAAPATLPPPVGALPNPDPLGAGAAQPGAPTGLDEVKVGDKLIVYFTDVTPEIRPAEVTVREDGTITLMENRKVLAAGKKRGQLEDEIRAQYVPSFYRRLTVTIKAEDRFFTVGGEVRQPGRQLYSGTMTVLQAIAATGGFTEFANKRRVEIIRSNGQKETVDCIKAQEDPRLNLPVYPYDQIHVHRRII